MSPVLGDMGTVACGGEARVLWETQLSLAVLEEGTRGAHKHLPLWPPLAPPTRPRLALPLSSFRKLTLQNPRGPEENGGGGAGMGKCWRILSCSCCTDIVISIRFRRHPFSHWDLNLYLGFSSERTAAHFCFKVCKLPTLQQNVHPLKWPSCPWPSY